MSDYFWSVVNYVYEHRLTPSEGAGACAAGATVGRLGGTGGYIGIGTGCAIAVIHDIITKFFDIGSPVIAGDCETSGNCDTSGDRDTSASNSCPISDFGVFGTNSDSWPTVSSGWT